MRRGGPLDSGGPRPTFTALPAFTARRGASALALGGAHGPPGHPRAHAYVEDKPVDKHINEKVSLRALH